MEGSTRITLPPDEAHHLKHVLRLGVGAEVAVFDGRGREWAARAISLGKARDVTVELLEEIAPVAEPPVRVTLGIGVLKGDQMDAVVRDVTALGVAEIVPVASEHVSVPSRAWRSGAASARWQRIAVAAAKQCGRAVVPELKPVARLPALLEQADVDARLMSVEPKVAASRELALGSLNRPSTALALVGPEGGWANGELDLAVRRGVTLVHLGPRTLRAETAPTVLLSSLWTVWGWSA